MAPVMQYADQRPLDQLTLRIWPGSGEWTLYEDDIPLSTGMLPGQQRPTVYVRMGNKQLWRSVTAMDTRVTAGNCRACWGNSASKMMARRRLMNTDQIKDYGRGVRLQ